MSHRPWEATPSTSRNIASDRIPSSPPPYPRPPPDVEAGIPAPPNLYAINLPPIRNNKRRRTSTSNSNSSNNPPVLQRRFQYPTASSLAPLVAQLYAAVVSPGAPRSILPEHPTLDDLGHCLESVLNSLPNLSNPKLGAAQSEAGAVRAPSIPAINPLELARLSQTNSQLSTDLASSRKRFEAINKKAESLTDENEQLINEKERLQGNIDFLEETVDELRAERDEALKQLRVSGAQWTTILGNAAVIQERSWGEDKRVREIGTAPGEENRAGCAQCSCLRKRVETLENALEGVKESGKEMSRVVMLLQGVGQRVEAEAAKALAVGGGRGCCGTHRPPAAAAAIPATLPTLPALSALPQLPLSVPPPNMAAMYAPQSGSSIGAS
ncbi:hypothetical protein FPQ18DRAFT_342352 [Pyronema domesticum]|nr:hypothetical protein FPQ18DRAFT_342352 [Pyronema domesticum]